MSSDIAISVKGLGKSYHIYKKPQDRLKQSFLWGRKKLYEDFWALKDVSFEVKRGETVGIIGRNGSGKSTLLQIICGTLKPTQGEVEVNGRIAALLELGSGFDPEFTGKENVYLNAAILGLKGEEIDERYESIIEFADIGDFIDQPVKTYSSGMYVRLAFAVAANVDPDILVVDEALSVGDIAFQQKCFHRITTLQEKGVTVLLVAHDTLLINNYCAKALYLKQGRGVALGDAENITEAYIKDFHTDQQDRYKGRGKLVWKDMESGKSFGTEHGKFCDLTLWRGDTEDYVFKIGDSLTVKTTAFVDKTVVNPKVTIQLRDVRGYHIYGTDSLVSGVTFPQTGRADGLISVSFTFDVKLAPGPYSFTIGLTDHVSNSIVIVHEKLIGVLDFTVHAGKKKFHGVVDLEAACEVITIDKEKLTGGCGVHNKDL